MRPRPSHRPSRRGSVVAVLVIGGLVASITGGVFLIERPTGELPGIALGSEAILVIERITILFAAGLLGLVVIVRALVGELPIEISGRGLRYADAATSQADLLDSSEAMDDLDREVKALGEAVVALEQAQGEIDSDRLCAVEGSCHGH